MILCLKTDQLTQGMILGQDIVNNVGQLLFNKGHVIDSTDLFWIDNMYVGNEVLVEETKLDNKVDITDDYIVEGVLNSIYKSYNTDSMLALLSNLNATIGAHFSKVYPQLLDLRKTDPITFEHSINVTWYSLFLANKVGIDSEGIKIILEAALLHDIGKSFIPATILAKTDKLTEEEFEIIKQHSIYGETWTSSFTSKRISKIIRHHHEYLDGSGYPDGLKKEDIDPLCHIITVVDIFDALSSNRAYRKGLSPFEAYIILIEEAAKGKIDITLVDIFSEVFELLRGASITVNGMDGTFECIISSSRAEVYIKGNQVYVPLGNIVLNIKNREEEVIEL